MKKYVFFLLIIIFFISLSSCSNDPTDKAKSAAKSYLKENLKNLDSYEPISFSILDTSKIVDKNTKKSILIYSITHFYSIKNSENEEVKMSIPFYFDKNFKVIEPTTKSLNGDYGILTGSVYWKYNNFIGNRADAGSRVILYSLDSIRNKLKYETEVDVQGSYKIEKVLAGKYFLVVNSKNTTDCPEIHLAKLESYSSSIKQLFGFDTKKYKTQLNEIHKLDSLYFKTLSEFPTTGTLSKMNENISKTETLQKEIRDKSEKLISIFPEKFRSEIELYTGYSKANDFSIITIEEKKSANQNTDFGITCI